MTEESENTPVGDAPEGDAPNRGDWLLQTLVTVVNSVKTANIEESGFPITLNVGGFLVSGQMIGGAEFFERFSRLLSRGDEPDDEGMLSSFRQFKSIYEEEDEADDTFVSYIHLKDARFFHTSGSPVPQNEPVLWRGRIDSVDGFFVGSLSAGSGGE